MAGGRERLWAAFSHLGIPLGSVLIPLLVWGTGRDHSFRRLHARQAFSFQMTYLFVYIGCAVWAFFGTTKALVISIAIAFVLEIPQVVRALRGLTPYPFPPLDLLKP